MSWSIVVAFAVVAVSGQASSGSQAPQLTDIDDSATIQLLTVWPEIAAAPKSKLATIEVLVRPDRAAVERARSLILVLSNRNGSDVAGIGLEIAQGQLRASVLGVKLKAQKPLPVDRWSHVALTINTRTINKQARLWVDGRLVASELVLPPWPRQFEVAEMCSDPWKQGRNYTGQLGDVRFSRIIRYSKSFDPPSRFVKDETATLRLDGGDLPLDGSDNQ